MDGSFFRSYHWLYVLLTLVLSSSVSGKTTLVTNIKVALDRWYSGTVDYSSTITFTFDYRVRATDTRALRLQVQSRNASTVSPLIVVVRESKRVTSWEIPLYLEKTYPYWAVRRTLCPRAVNNGTVPEQQQVSVDLTTQSRTPVNYDFNIWFVPGFILKTNKVIDFRVSPSAPAFFQYQIPEGINRVLVRTWAAEDESVCSILSIQPTYCPIADLPEEITGQGEYQTFTTRGAFLLKREDVQLGKFDVVLVALSEDHKCVKQQGWVPQLQKDDIDIALALERNHSGEWDDTSLFSRRQKHVFLVVENVLSESQYWIAVASVGIFYIMFYVIFRIALCFGFLTKRTVNVPERHSTSEVGSPKHSPDGHPPIPEETEMQHRHRTVSFHDEKKKLDRDHPKEKKAHGSPKSPHVKNGISSHSDLSSKHDGKDDNPPGNQPSEESTVGERMDKEAEELVEEDLDDDAVRSAVIDNRADHAEHVQAMAGKAVITVTEISMRPIKKMIRRDRAYNWTLLIIAVFYSLPVVQLVLTYQRMMDSTGNTDMCYYNFQCAHPAGRLNDFNHVFSNVGYVALGLLFCLIVWKRQKYHYRHEKEILQEEDEHAVGLPPQYGLFYAMGISLIMEGVMSACYHICPNYTNFQFDTSFMYLLGGLFMLKIYQSRHADISPHAQVAYAVFAFWIFVAVLGVVIDKQWFWTTFCVVLVILSIPFGVQIYYMGSWKFDAGMFGRTLKLISGREDGAYQCARPTALDRFGLLIMIYAINWIMAIGGAVFTPTDFSTFLLIIVLANAFFYFIFYIVMKMRSGEKIPHLSKFFMALAGITWGGAIYFFIFRLTNWVLTPSVSRQGNEKCFFLDFYDQHDVWHMMSACSMFFNFMILFTLDDDLFCVPRSEIRVF